jgi:1-acyl-sn-glycerol-3-phosphate acyltransferase
VQSWPLFGQMVSLAGTIFIDRGERYKTPEFVQKIVGVLNKKINILLFPEGTSTDGSKVLPFQSVFFAAPFIAHSVIVPVVIRYTAIDGQSLSERNKDRVYWYGQEPFFKHLWQFLELRNVDVHVKVCAVIETGNFSSDSYGRKQLSSYCRDIISRELKDGIS